MFINCPIDCILILLCVIFYKRFTLNRKRDNRKKGEYFETGLRR